MRDGSRRSGEAPALLCGRRPVWELLEAGRRSVHKLWIAKGAAGDLQTQILRRAREKGIPVEWVDRHRLDQMTRGAHHQGVAAQAAAVPLHSLDDFLVNLSPAAASVVVAMDEIQDPQNVGAILRSAGFFGASAVIVPQWRNAPVSEAAARASAGALEHLPVIRVHNLVQCLDALKESGFEAVGADMNGDPLERYEPGKKTVLVMGNEEKGLRRLVREHCDRILAVSPRSPVASLNVGSAAAIFLYALTHRRENT